MYIEASYYCPKCREHKSIRMGNQGLPLESLAFQIEIKGFNCPACGTNIKGLSSEDYIILPDN